MQKKYRKVASEVIPKAEFLLRFGLGENLLESELENSGYSVNLTWALHLWIYILKRRNKYTVYLVINNISSKSWNSVRIREFVIVQFTSRLTTIH